LIVPAVQALQTQLKQAWPLVYLYTPVADLVSAMGATSSFAVSLNMSSFGLPATDAEWNINDMANHATALSPKLFDAIDWFIYAFFIFYVVMRVWTGTWGGFKDAVGAYGSYGRGEIVQRKGKSYITITDNSSGQHGSFTRSRKVG